MPAPASLQYVAASGTWVIIGAILRIFSISLAAETTPLHTHSFPNLRQGLGVLLTSFKSTGRATPLHMMSFLQILGITERPDLLQTLSDSYDLATCSHTYLELGLFAETPVAPPRSNFPDDDEMDAEPIGVSPTHHKRTLYRTTPQLGQELLRLANKDDRLTVVVRLGRQQLTSYDIWRLQGEWINDELINTWGAHIQHMYAHDHSSFQVLSTFFFEKLELAYAQKDAADSDNRELTRLMRWEVFASVRALSENMRISTSL